MASRRKKGQAGVGQGKGGGPKSRDGKARSSQNSTTHGMRARPGLILPDERREDFDEIEKGWREEYQPEGHAENTLVDQLILNQWLMKRAERRVLQAEEAAVGECGDDPHSWTEERRHTFELMQRYKTTAERAFYRSWNAVQGLRKDRMRMDDRMARLVREGLEKDTDIQRLKRDILELMPKAPSDPAKGNALGNITKKYPFGEAHAKAAAEAKTAAQMLFQGQLHPKKQRKIAVLDQWIEVTVENGKTVTTLHPPNDELIKAGQRMLPPPEMVYRRFNFVGPVPPEYLWSTKDPVMLANGGMGIQRIYVDTWLELIEKEKALGTGHLGPTGVGNMPRPMERGGCDCEVCAGNRAILEARAEAG